MIHFKFSDKDNRYIYIKTDGTKEDKEHMKLLSLYMNKVDPICYLKTWSAPPHTIDFLYEYVQKSGAKIWYSPVGEWKTITAFLDDNHIEYDGIEEDRFKTSFNMSLDEFKEIVDSWNLSVNPRPYQYEAAYNVLKWRRSLSVMPTRSGKTLISYMIFRFAREKLGVRRILMVVPGIDLVKQGFQDFKDYGDYFNSECIWSGGKTVESSDLTIATFQSLVNFLDKKSKRYNPHFFDGNGIDRCGYDMVFVDETHRATAKSIKEIISQPFMSDVKIAFGMTGTLPKDGTLERLGISALLGHEIQAITPKELQDEGYISDLHITQVRLKYADERKTVKNWIACAEYALSTFDERPKESDPKKKEHIPLENPQFLISCKKSLPQGIIDAKWKTYSDKKPEKSAMTDRDWQDYLDLRYKKFLETIVQESTKTNALHIEAMSVHFKEERVKWLVDKMRECPKNTLILAQHREYIKYIYDELKKAYPDRPVMYVIGGSRDRKIVKQMMIENKNCIVVAGYQLMSTGITLSDLCYGFLFESYKSNVINMQSIGRGLGLSALKDKYVLYDVTDEFDRKLASNKIYLQGLQRIKIYKENHWQYDISQEWIGNDEHIDDRIVKFVYDKKKSAKATEKKEKKGLAFKEQDLFK